MKKIKIFLTLCVVSNILFAQENDPWWQYTSVPFIPQQNNYKIINNLQDNIIHENKKDTTFSTFKTISNPPSLTALDDLDILVFPSSNIQSEPHISISRTIDANGYPGDATRDIIISANTFVYSTGFHNQGVYFYDHTQGPLTNSYMFTGDDQGFVFTLPTVPEVSGDPSTAFDADGIYYVTTLGAGSHKATLGYNSIPNSFQISDGVPRAMDKQMIAIDDMPNSPYKNNFYIVYFDPAPTRLNIIFKKSTDIMNGANFPSTGMFLSSPISVSGGFSKGPNVQTGPEGQVYVCWANMSTGNYPADGMGFTKSLDGGQSFSPQPTDPALVVFPYVGIAQPPFGNQPDILFGGTTPHGATRVNDFPSMAVDKSCGFYNGRIYIAYPEKENGNANDKSVIRVRYSDDEGSSWSSPITVSIPNASNAAQSWFPWIAVDDMTGDVCVVYYSFDNPPTFETNTYVAYSSDGGNTFLNQKVSDQFHITKEIDPSYTIYNAPGYAGDYIGIAAHGGICYPVWMDDRTGTWQIYISPLTLTSLTTSTINPPTPNDINISAPFVVNTVHNTTYKAVHDITVPVPISNTYSIPSGETVIMRAGNEIILQDGFVANAGSEFHAYIEPYANCITPVRMANNSNPQHHGKPVAMSTSYQPEQDQTASSQNSAIAINPNPSNGIFHLTITSEQMAKGASPVFNVTVNNVLGEIVYQSAISSPQSSIDLTAQPKGIYFVKVVSMNKVFTEKVIIQ